jgi:hypothetical protein
LSDRAEQRQGDARAILREPLLHFLAAGAALFALHAAFGGGDETSRARPVLRVSESDVAWIIESWSRQRLRPPDEAELRGLVAEFLREEVLAQEARALGLDTNDTVVRRRLAQKMTFLDADAAAAAEPSEAELRADFAREPGSHEEPARFSFSQVFFSTERRGAAASDAAREALDALTKPGAAADASSLGDATLLPPECAEEDAAAIAAQFGESFARALAAAPQGAWHGPVQSAYGLHLVRVSARTAGRKRSFEEARPDLVAEWRRVRVDAAREERLSALLRKYEVVADPAIEALLPDAVRSK